MGGRDRKDIRPLLLRFGLAVSVSFAGFLASRIAANRIHMAKQPPPPLDHGSSEAEVRAGDDVHAMKITTGSGSMGLEGQEDVCRVNFSPSCRLTEDKDGYLLPEFNHLINNFSFSSVNKGASPKGDPVMMLRVDADTPKAFRSIEEEDEDEEEDDNYHEIEISHLKNKVRLLEERERNLELQLLELYGLKEQETAVMELQNRVKINSMETKLLTLKMETLQAENQRLQAQAADHMKTLSELDAARAKIKLLKKKLRSQTEQNKEQILILKKKVSKLQEQEIDAASSDPQLQRLKDLEVQAQELRKSNSNLQEENSDLAHRLDATQLLANSVLENPEMEELRQLSNRLSEENMHLTKEVERVKADRCSDVEELVYLRWINACLRYELRNFQTPNGKTAARDLSKSLSPESEEKAKKLILQYANADGMGEKGMRLVDLETDQWLSSQASCITDSTNFDDSSSVSSSKPPNSPRKLKIFKKLRRLLRGKDDHRSSPLEKTAGGMEDSDYPSSISTGTDAGSDTQSFRGQTPLTSYRYSIDSHRVIIPGMYDAASAVKDIDSLRVTSDLGSSDVLRRFSSPGAESGRDFTSESHPSEDLYPTGKSDLVRFAGVLKDSSGNNITEPYHRKGKSSVF